MNRADVVVVGGGVIGTSIAWAAAAGGMDVVLLERDRVGAHASRVAAGMLAPYAEGGSSGLPLGRESLERFPELARHLREKTGTAIGFRRCGILRVARDEREAAELRAVRSHPSQVWLDATETRRREPALAPGVAGALWSPEEGQVDPERLTGALAQAARAAGAAICEDEAVHRLELSGERVVGVESTQGTWHAAWVVLATGPWAGAPTWPAGLRALISPVRGQLLHWRGVRLRSGAVIWSESAYLVPRLDRILVGATEERSGFDARVTERATRQLTRAALALAPGLAGSRRVETRAALRPCTPDRLPLVGRDPHRPGLLLALGHFRNGILLAPTTAELIVDSIRGRPLPAAAARFDPARFERPAESPRGAPNPSRLQPVSRVSD